MSATMLAAPAAATSSARRGVAARHTETHIEGRYRPIPAHQLASAAWLYSTGRITRRQLRVWFALHEMAEQRNYAKTKTAQERPVFLVEQVAQLVGGRGSATALRDLRADIKHLAEVGLATMAPHALQFAKSTDTLSVGEGGSDALETFLGQIPNVRRSVPVPRRLVRALAAGFSRAEILYAIAALLRSVFWRKSADLFTVDGRMKLSWVADLFGLSRRSVTAARGHLIQIGWLRPLKVHQMMANLYGVHDVVNVHWKPGQETGAEILGDEGQELSAAADDTGGAEGTLDPSTEAPTALPTDSVDNPTVGEGRGGLASGGSASPTRHLSAGSASPRNKKSPSTKGLNTRKLGVGTPDPALVGSREKKIRGAALKGVPSLRDVRAGDLLDTDRLFELYRQAQEAGLAKGGGAGRHDFLALAHRAAMRGKNPGALLMWLLRNQKTDFITLSDESAAAERVRDHFDGPVVRSSEAERRAGQFGSGSGDGPGDRRGLTEDEEMVERCLRAAKVKRLPDAFAIVEHGAQWTRERWETALWGYRSKQARSWMSKDELGEW